MPNVLLTCCLFSINAVHIPVNFHISAVGATTKSIMIPAGAILQGNHFMLQQANMASTSKVITPQQLLSGKLLICRYRQL